MTHAAPSKHTESSAGLGRVTRSIFFASSFMFAFYMLLMHGPTMVDAHALLFRFFENEMQAQAVIANFAIGVTLAMQLITALASVYVGKQLTGPEKQEHTGFLLLWLLYPVLLVPTAIVLALAGHTPQDVSKLTAPNAALTGHAVFFSIIVLVACFYPPYKAESKKLHNPIYALTMGKLLVLPFFAFFEPTKLTLTIVLGSYVLDKLLLPVGDKIQESSRY